MLAFELHQNSWTDFSDAAINEAFGVQLEASVQSFLIGPVVITGGPQDVTVVEGGTATFSVMQAGGATFRCQQNSNDISGATNATHVIPSVSMSLDGARFRVAVSNAISGALFTTNATLHVLPDTNRPVLLAAFADSGNTVTLSFSEPLAALTATNAAYYLVTNSFGSAQTISRAALTNGTNVILTLAAPLAGRYGVVVNDVNDTAANPNLIAPNSGAAVSADYFIPMTSAWKYLIINTTAAVQSAFMQPGYDDSAWLGPSNALFYVEPAALPAAKNTPLSFYEAGDVLHLYRINTHYFRQTFVAPATGGHVTAQLRHIIDDGMVLYLNGVEIYRFNLPPGPVTAASSAPATIGDATLLGPFALDLPNLVGGTNILAVEVHQSGPSSGDVVMGVELSIHVPGGAPMAVDDPKPRVTLTPIGGWFALTWSEDSFALECSAAVTGPWTPVAGLSPYFVPPANAAAFYRLRR